MNRRRILIYTTGFLAALFLTGYVVLHHTGATRGLVRSVLNETFHEGLFRLGDAEISLTSGTVTLRNFELQNPELEAGQSPLLSVDRIDVEVETNPLAEVGTVRAVHLDGLVLNLSLADGELPILSRILKVAGVTPGPKIPLPSIRAENSTIHLRVAEHRPTVTFTGLTLSVLPVADNPDALVLTGTMTSPLGHEIEVHGEGDTVKRTLRAMLALQDLPLKPEQAACFQPEAAEYLGTANVTGTVQSASLWLDVRNEIDPKTGQRSQQMHVGMQAEFTGLAAKPQHFPYPIQGATGRVYATLDDGGRIGFEIDNKSADGHITANGEITKWFSTAPDAGFQPKVDLQLRLQDLKVGPRLRQAFATSSVPDLVELEAALAPTEGRISGTAQLFNRSPGAELHVAADVTVVGGASTFHGYEFADGSHVGFPYPVQGIHGRVTFHGDTVTLDKLQGSDADGAEVFLDGEIHVTAPVRTNLDLHTRGARFSPQLRAALADLIPEGAAIYDRYAPKGGCDAVLRLRDFGQGVRYSVELSPRDASAEFADFPYRVEGLSGLVKIANEGVWIDLQSAHAGTEVSIDGRFLLEDVVAPGTGDMEDLQAELWVEATGLPLDARFRQAATAFAPELQDVWDLTQPEAQMSFEFTLWKDIAAKDFSYDVHLGLKEGRARVRNFPIPIRDLAGDIYIYGTGAATRCDLQALRGKVYDDQRAESADLLVQGTVSNNTTGLGADITTVCRRMRLSSIFRDAAVAGGLGTAEVWDALALDGLVDVTSHHTLAPGQKSPRERATVRLRDVESRAAALPGVARGLHGAIEVSGTKATFDRIEGRIDNTAVTLRGGTLGWEDDFTAEFLVDAESVPLDARLAEILNGPVRQAYLDSKATGRVGLSGFKLGFQYPAGGALTTTFRGNVDAHDLFFDVGLPGGNQVQHLTGTVHLAGKADGSGASLEGDLRNIRCELTNRGISGLSTRFTLDSTALELFDLECNFAEGRIWGGGENKRAIRYDFEEPGRLRADILYSDLSLGAMLRARGLAHSKVRGLLSGALHIEELRGDNFLDMRAHGDVVVNSGRLGRVPLFSALYSHIEESKRPQFTEGSTRFLIKNQRIELKDIKARSREFQIEGGGTLAMDGYLDVQLRLPGVFGRAADILILPPLIDWTVSKVASFQLYGYIRSPVLAWTFSKEFGRPPIAPIGPVLDDPAGGRGTADDPQPSKGQHHP